LRSVDLVSENAFVHDFSDGLVEPAQELVESFAGTAPQHDKGVAPLRGDGYPADRMNLPYGRLALFGELAEIGDGRSSTRFRRYLPSPRGNKLLKQFPLIREPVFQIAFANLG
jgi:hypothetical protein